MTRRTLTPAALVAGGLATALLAGPRWAPAAGLDVWNLPGLHRQWDEETARREQLDGTADELHRCNAVKRAVLADLAAGRTDLGGAADEFLALAEAGPWQIAGLRAQFPRGSDRDRAAQSVLSVARHRGGFSAAELARLEAEYRTLFPGEP